MCQVCAGYDSRFCPVCAPEIKGKRCEHCDGDGTIYYRYDECMNTLTEVSPKEWISLPEECQHEDTCGHCKGEGVIYRDYYDY